MKLILQSENVQSFKTKLDEHVVVNHVVGYRFETLLAAGVADCVLVESEDGFCQLGKMREFLSNELGLAQRDLIKHVMDGFPATLERNISSLVDWNRGEADNVTLVCIPSGNPASDLKGLILTPYDGSKCYLKFAWGENAKPYRDFFYNVTYESIAYAHQQWGAKKLVITHFSRNNWKSRYHPDITSCQIEAITHYCNKHSGIESFTFFDDSKGNKPIQLLRQFIEQVSSGEHRAISSNIKELWGIGFVELDWTGQ